MKNKYIHLALASLALASCGGNAPASNSSAEASSLPPASSSSVTPSSSGATSLAPGGHDKAKTIENLLAAKTYRLDNFTYMETEATQSDFKAISYTDAHSYFEVHDLDSVYWSEVAAGTNVKLSDYLVKAQMTLEEFKEYAQKVGGTGITFIIDEENDALTMTMDMSSFGNQKTYSFYNAEAKQYEQYVYSIDVETKEEACTRSSYLPDSGALTLEVPMAINELVLYTLNEGEFDADTCSYVVSEVDVATLPDILKEGAPSFAKGFTLTVKDNYPDKFLLDIDPEVISTLMGMEAPEGANVLVASYGVEFDYEGPFLDLAGKRLGVDCALKHHGHAQYEYHEEGFRPYCANCFKYLGEEEPYAYDETYHVCVKSGHIDGLDPKADAVYQGLIYADVEEGIEYYAFSYNENAKYGTNWNAREFAVKEINPYGNYNLETVTFYEEDLVCHYWPAKQALIVEKTDSDEALPGSCYVITKTTLSLYKGIALDMEHAEEFDEWLLISDGTPIGQALNTLHADDSIESYYLSEYHEHTHEVTYEGEGCELLHVEVCEDCGQEVNAYTRPTNHTFTSGLTLTYSEMNTFLESVDANEYWDESDIVIIAMAVCEKCKSPVMYVVTHEYAENGNYWIGTFDDDWGEFSFCLTNDPLPELNDSEGKPIFPIVD
ncbi:MAG: hypothetical protein J6O18_00340 [Bacilli bacterium]|nr:hypothetical protein [Bacilli bacterium]